MSKLDMSEADEAPYTPSEFFPTSFFASAALRKPKESEEQSDAPTN